MMGLLVGILVGIYIIFRAFPGIGETILIVIGIALDLCIAGPVIFGGFYGVRNLVLSVREHINVMDWDWKGSSEPARRSYFYGPGYQQIWSAATTMLEMDIDSGKRIYDIIDDIKIDIDFAPLRWLFNFFLIMGELGLCLAAAMGIGTGAAFGILIFGAMIVTGMIFSVVRSIDAIYLKRNKIRSYCPICKESFTIPMFMCPRCGEMHKSLVPGPYGIWKHRCKCGKLLPSTFMNGRSRLQALCPMDGAELAASDVQSLAFQMVGGTSSGKTTYLSAFYHEFLDKLKSSDGISAFIPEAYRPMFEELEKWYSGEKCPVTTELNSTMYPVMINGNMNVGRQFSVYDIAGEMFDGTTAETVMPLSRFLYCDGVFFLIDPYSSEKLREERINAGRPLPDYCPMDAEKVAVNYINYLIKGGNEKANVRFDIPIAVLVVKADLEEVECEIGAQVIEDVFQSGEKGYQRLEEARDSECRKFLTKYGFLGAIDNLETQFSNIHYFPVSAIGHFSDGSVYMPKGTLDAMKWMLSVVDKELSDRIAFS